MPVAYLVSGRADGKDVEDARSMDDEVRLTKLEHQGVVVRRSNRSPADVLGQPLPAATELLQALLDERCEELREGGR